MSVKIKNLIALLLTVIILVPGELFAIELDMPLKCNYGTDCFIQNYVDTTLKQKKQALDYQCSTLTYNGHKGTDFRIKNYKALENNYQIVAAADGIVKAVRNNAEDYEYIKDGSTVTGKECGNGIVIRHLSGFETQYCHLRKDSIKVRAGAKINSGDLIGIMGMSGKTEFPHLHFEVRKNGKIIDPFLSEQPVDNLNCNSTKNPIWKKQISDLLQYIPLVILDSGFTDQIPQDSQQASELSLQNNISANSSQLIFWFEIIGIKKDDVLTMVIIDPDNNIIVQNTKKPAKNQARYFQYIGKKNLKLKAGIYSGQIVITSKDSDPKIYSNSLQIKELKDSLHN